MGQQVLEIFGWARRRKLLASAFLVLTLVVGILIGSIVSGRTSAMKAMSAFAGTNATPLKLPDPVPSDRWADVHRTDRFICARPLSGHCMLQPEDDDQVIYLPPDAPGEALGRALLACLGRSRFISPTDRFERLMPSGISRRSRRQSSHGVPESTSTAYPAAR